MQNLRMVGKNAGQVWSHLWTKVHNIWERYRTPLVVVNTLDWLSIFVAFRRYRPLKFPLSCEVIQKRCFFGSWFVWGGDTPDFRHAFLNRSYFRVSGRFWLGSVQWPPRFGGEKEEESLVTVCTVVQNCCNGRSKMYRKWHFWGCSLSETLQRIDIKLTAMITSVTGVNTLNGISIGSRAWSPRRGEMLMVCAFLFFLIFSLLFVCSLAPLQVKPLDRFWRVIRQNACFYVSCIPFGVRTMTSQF